MKSLIIGLVAAISISTAHADWKPSGPVNLLIGFGAGGSTDTLGRVIASEIERIKGWNMVVQNKPGGGGVAMLVALAKTGKKDGTSIGMGINMSIQGGLALKGDDFPLQLDDLMYISSLANLSSSLVARGDAPYNNIAEFIAWSKSNGGQGVLVSQTANQAALINMLSTDNGLNLKSFRAKGGANAMKALLGGDADMIISSGPHVPLLKDNTVKIIAFSTHTRHAYSPDTKTLREQGVNYAISPRFFWALPKDSDPAAKQAWADVITEVLKTNAVKDITTKLGMTIQNVDAAAVKQDIIDGAKEQKELLSR